MTNSPRCDPFAGENCISRQPSKSKEWRRFRRPAPIDRLKGGVRPLSAKRRDRPGIDHPDQCSGWGAATTLCISIRAPRGRFATFSSVSRFQSVLRSTDSPAASVRCHCRGAARARRREARGSCAGCRRRAFDLFVRDQRLPSPAATRPRSSLVTSAQLSASDLPPAPQTPPSPYSSKSGPTVANRGWK
jgi:hypothetical protein